MLLTLKKSKRMLLLTVILCSFGACKQSEFYDKAKLLDPSKPASDESVPSSVSENDPATPEKAPSTDDLPNILFPEDSSTKETHYPSGSIPPVAVTPKVDASNSNEILIERTELFTQDSVRDGDVDVLFMIDNSGSMANKQKRLSESLGLFIDKFLDKKINFKMAITTTDGTKNKNGKMIGDANKLTSDYLKLVGKTQFMSYFSQMTKVGIDGSGVEQGLKTSSAFFDRYSSSFLRNDAYLALVEISDEDDQSEKSVKDYVTKYQSLKKNKGMVKIYSIVTLKLPMDNTLSDSFGEHYKEASLLTGGTVSEIKDDFSTILTDLGTNIVNLVDSFSLAEIPYDNNPLVYVNKVLVTNGWSYNSISHSIKFESTHIPAAGAQIEIHYKVKANVIGAI